MKYLKTSEAARYCTERGRPTSPSYLRQLRLKGVDDPGVKSPEWVRDPGNGYVYYSTDCLDRWVDEWEARLSDTLIAKPDHLVGA